MSQFNLRYVPTLSCNEFILNGQRWNTQAANICGNMTSALTTEVIINNQTKNQALYCNILTLESEISGNVNPNLVVVDARLTALESNVSILQGNVVFIQNEIDVINSNIGNINANIASLNANTMYLHAPYTGLGGNTSYFTNGLQVWNGANETGNGIFSYVDGASVSNQIRLSVQNAKGIFLDGGSTTIAPTSGGNVNINGSGATGPFSFNVFNPNLLNANIRMKGDIELTGNGNSSISIFTQPASLIPPTPATDYVNIRGGNQAQILGPAINVQADSSLNLQAGNGGTISLGTPSSGSTNSTINIGTNQGATNTGYQVITIGSGGVLQARNSSTFLEGDNYLPYVAATNTGLWDGITYVGLPTVYSGPLHGPVKTTYTPYVKSISTYFAGATVNSFISTAGSFTVGVGIGSINLTCGAGGFLCSTGAGLLALTTGIGAIALTTAGGAITATTAGGAIQFSLGAGSFTSTTGVGVQRLETGAADIQIAAGYAPSGTAGDVVITAKGNIAIEPDVGLYLEKVSHAAFINNGTTPPGLPSYSLYTLNGNLYYNGNDISSSSGVSQVIAGNGITVSPIGGTGVVTVSAIGSVIPPGGYLPVIGGNMVGDIYMKNTASSAASHIYQGNGAGQVKLFRPMSSYQAPFPSIGPPTYTGELLCFYNGDNNAPTQSNFTGWFPQSLVSAQPDFMTQLITGASSTVYSLANSGTPSPYDNASCVAFPTFTNGVHITGGTVYISQIETTKPLTLKFAPPTGQTFYTRTFPAGSFPSSGLFTFTLDYTHTSDTGQYAAFWDNSNSNFSLMVANPLIKTNWCGTLTAGTASYYLMAFNSGLTSQIFKWFPGQNTTEKVFTLDGSLYGIQEQLIGSRILYFYGLFDNITVPGPVSARVNNIFTINVDNTGIVQTLRAETALQQNPPIGTNGAVYGVEVDTFNDRTWFWGDFTYVGTDYLGNVTPPRNDIVLKCGCDFTTTADWQLPVMFEGINGYNECHGGKLLNSALAGYSLMVWANQISNGANPPSFLSFQAIGMNYYQTGTFVWTVAAASCFTGGNIPGIVSNIQRIQNAGGGSGNSRLFFTGSYNNGVSNLGSTCLSIMFSDGDVGVDNAVGQYLAPLQEVYNSSDTTFWVDNGIQISVTNVRKMSNDVFVMNTNGYGLTNGGGVLTVPSVDETALTPTKYPITGMPRYSTKFIGGNDATKILLTCSLNQNNFFYSQTFDSTISPVPIEPTVIAINGAKFLVDNTPMDKIVFAGSDQDYSSVSFIAGKVEDNDYNWYWQAQVGQLNYYAGATLYPNISACPTQPVVPGPTTSTWGTVLLNGNVASKGIDMSGFDIINANTITAGNILTLSAPNAVEVGVGTRRIQPVLTVILDTLGNNGESNFSTNYVISAHFSVSLSTNFQKNSLQGYFRFDDGMGGGFGYLTPSIYQQSTGILMATGTATYIAFGSGQNYSFSFPNDVLLPPTDTYYFTFTTDGQSPSYYFYGWQTADPTTVCSFAEAVVYAPVTDPLDFFNVYGNTFVSDRITSYGDILFENPSASLVANVLVNKTGMTINNVTDNTYITSTSIQQINTANPGVSSDLQFYRLNMYDNLSYRTGQITAATHILTANPPGYANTNTMQIDGYRVQYYQYSNYSTQAQLLSTSGSSTVFLSASQLSGTPVGYSMTIETPISGSFKLACSTLGGSSQKTLDITNTGNINIQTSNISSSINLVVNTANINIINGFITQTAQQTSMQTPTNNNSLTVNTGSVYAISTDIDDINNPTLQIWNSNVSTTSYPCIKIHKTNTSTLAGNTISAISSWARDYTNTSLEWSRIQTKVENNSVGNQDATLSIFNIVNGTLSETFNFNGGQNEINSFRPLDMNGNDVRSTTGNVVINSNISTGLGQVQIQTKGGTAGSGTGFQISGNTLTSSSAGGSSGHHMCITLPDPTTGLPRVYKIALLNP